MKSACPPDCPKCFSPSLILAEFPKYLRLNCPNCGGFIKWKSQEKPREKRPSFRDL
jgi:ribosomal protein S27AE